MFVIIKEIFKEKAVPVKTIIDNKLTVDAIHSTAPVEDKKLRRNVARIKQMLIMMEIKSVSWCPGREQVAGCMTKKPSLVIIQFDAGVGSQEGDE